MFREFIPHISIDRIKRAYQIMNKAFAGYKWHIVLLTFLGILTGLFEGIGINALIPLFTVFTGNSISSETDTVSYLIRQGFEFFHIPFVLPALLVFIALLFIAKAITLFIFDYIQIRIQSGYELEMRKNLLGSTLRANWRELLTHKLGHLSSVVRTDINLSSRLLGGFSSLIMILTSTLVYLIFAFNISQTITFFAIVVGVGIFIILKPLLYRTRKVATKTTAMFKEVDQHVNESISGIKTIKAYSEEDSISKLGNSKFETFRQLVIQRFIYSKLATGFIEPASIIFVVSIIAFSFYQTSYNLGALAAIIYLTQRSFTYIQQSQRTMHNISNSVPYLEQLLRYQEKADNNLEDPKRKGNKPFDFSDEIVFKGVDFRYDKKPILKNINLNIKKGEMVGFIGPSGGGKTSIFDIFLRLLDPTKGEVLIDGTNYQEINLKDWRGNIAYVAQDAFLTSGTVKENIKFYDDSITDEEVEQAAKKANALDFIKEMENGFDTRIGGDGVQVSAGQRQRLAIARALARKPQILLLDEATSALDRDSEKKIEETLNELRGEITIFIIAHRIQTIEKVDKLYVVDRGEIVESGSPKELLDKEGTYFSRVQENPVI